MKNIKKIPKLRFPEFKDSGEWVEKRLGDYIKILSGESPSKFNFVESGIPYYKVEQLNDSSKYLKDSFYHIKKTKKIASKGSIIFPKRGASILLNKIRILSQDSYFDTNLISIKTNNNLNNEFLYYFILKVNLSKIADTTSVPQINNKHLEPFSFYLPTLPEQQKIADTLKSLDDLIEAQSKKVEKLKEYKKGLMQKLFPAEGKKVPEIRFKEFSGEWVEKRLGDIGDIVTGSTPSTKNQAYYQNGKFLWVTPTDITEKKDIYKTEKLLSEDGLANGRIVPENSLLVTCIASIGKNTILREKGSCNQQINAITPKKNYDVDFLYYYIEIKKHILEQNASQGGMAILNKTDFSNIKLLFPILPEQQKIADTLSSLDKLIEAESKKIEALKKHKKGLMQQLFVSKEEL